MTVDLDAIRARQAAYRASHDHPGAFACCTAHASADDVPALVSALTEARKNQRDDLDRLLEEQMRDPEFAEAFRAAEDRRATRERAS